MTNRFILIETKIRGQWKRYEVMSRMFKGNPEDMADAVCKIMAEIIVDGHWPGSELRARWDEGGGEITMLVGDPLLDDYIVEARENAAAYAESHHQIFRSTG